MSTVYEASLSLHEANHGKLKVETKVPCETAQDLSLAYTPGVAEPCLKIKENPENAYRYTDRGNTVAVVTDGTAVLGLGDIGPTAGLPVMEGKALLMKRFAGIDAWPICLGTKDPEEIISICKAIAPGFGAINLEDISAPRCVTIERRLIEECSIPVFHDDQHGTAIVVLAALINCMKLKHTDPHDMKVVISGCGAAGSSIIRMLYGYGFTHIYAFDIDGNVDPDHAEHYDSLKQELLQYVNLDHQHYANLAEGLKGADIFVGVSAPRLVTKEMVQSMNPGCIVFSMANPEPEITYEDAKAAGAYIIGTGRSDYPNQVNNLLAFPGLFRGALDAKATRITESMKMAASLGIASLIEESELTPEHIIVSPFDERVVPTVAKAVSDACLQSGYYRKDTAE
jgi:malate dehydrogenase (oxaloacetate-decarboxylating)